MTARAGILFLALVGLAACAGRMPEVMHMASPEVLALDAQDVATVMLYAGFERDEILDNGTDLRNGLALYGASQIRQDDKVRAIFAVRGGLVHVSSKVRGSFIYDPETNSFK